MNIIENNHNNFNISRYKKIIYLKIEFVIKIYSNKLFHINLNYYLLQYELF